MTQVSLMYRQEILLVFKHMGLRNSFCNLKKESEVGDSSLTSQQKKCFITDSKERWWMHCPDKLLKTMCMTLQLQKNTFIQT